MADHVIGAQIDNTPAGWHPDDAPQIHYLEPKEGNDGNTTYVAHGEPAHKLLNSGMNLNALRPYFAWNNKTKKYVPVCNMGTQINAEGKVVPKPVLAANATLREDEWKTIDQTVLQVSRKQLAFYQSLVASGLTFPLSDALGTTVLGWDKMQDDDGDARLTMEPDIPPLEGRVTYDREYIPIPLVCKGFRLNIRELNASRRGGMPLDTAIMADATRKVTELIEKLSINGTNGITYGGGTLYGMLNYDHRVTGTLTSAWTNSSARDPLADVIAMKQDSLDIYHNGPWRMFIPTGYSTALEEDYTSGYPKSIRNRLLEVEGVNSIQTLDYMTAGNVVMMEMDQRTIRMIVGFEPKTIEWTSMGGMSFHYMIMAIMVPNPRADANNRTGIIHYSA
jgi:uncharacterized linocin/CFP29 family protein